MPGRITGTSARPHSTPQGKQLMVAIAFLCLAVQCTSSLGDHCCPEVPEEDNVGGVQLR